MSDNIDLYKFDMNKIQDNSKCVFIAKPRMGKTTLIKDLLWYKRHIPMGILICPTQEANGAYTGLIPDLFMYDDYDEDITSDFIQRQKNAKKRKWANPGAFYILDDCSFNASLWTKDKNMKYIFMNGRHLDILFIWSMQYCLGIPPDLRTSIDYIFLLKESFISNRKRIYEQYAGIFPTFEMFCTVFDNCTDDYECMVIDNTSTSSKLEDQVFWYKADQHPDFQVGCQEYWKHSAMYYNPEYDENQLVDNPNHLIKNSSTKRVKTRKGNTYTVRKIK